mgnify:CR=1 FL=1
MNKRVIFQATQNAFDKQHRYLTSIEPYSNAVVLQYGDKTYELIVADGSIVDYVAVIAEKAAKKEKIESEVATLTANLDDLKTQLKAKKAELKAATKELAKAENKKAAAEAKAAEEAKKGEAEDVLKKLLASGMTAEEILAKLQ